MKLLEVPQEKDMSFFFSILLPADVIADALGDFLDNADREVVWGGKLVI